MATSTPDFTTLPTTTLPPALTTTFSPSPFCTVDIYRINATETEGWYFDHLGPLASTSACFPSGWAPDSSVYFSPGVCPSGYTIACSSLLSLGSVTETRATCCPQSYGCQTEDGFPWYTTDICSMLSSVSGVFVYTTSTPGLSPVTITDSGRYGFNAYGLQIRWGSTDFVSEPTISSSATKIIASSVSSRDQPSPTTTLMPITAPQSGLQQSTRIGIGVGVAIGASLIIAAVIYLWLRRRRKRLEPRLTGSQELSAESRPAQLWTQVSELDSRQK